MNGRYFTNQMLYQLSYASFRTNGLQQNRTQIWAGRKIMGMFAWPVQNEYSVGVRPAAECGTAPQPTLEWLRE
jgi:hypothetical protein